MRRPLAVLVPLAAALLLAPAARAETIVIEGRGWGHGVGLSQYGAYGFALREGRDFRSILGHYYTGTTVGRAPPGACACCCGARACRRSAAPRSCATRRPPRAPVGAAHVRDLGVGGDGLAVTDTTTRRRRARVRAPVRIAGGASTCLRGLAENGVRDGAYRGVLRLHRDAGRVMVVNDVSLEQYLYGVVRPRCPRAGRRRRSRPRP